MDAAYIVKLPLEDNLCASGIFSGGDLSFRRDLDFGGINRKGFDLSGCIQFGIEAPDDFVASAPTAITLEKISKTLPDFGFGPWGGFHLVSEPFVKIVESLDPGMHQFIKIESTFNHHGDPITKTYYILNETNQISATNIEESNVEVENRTLHIKRLNKTSNIQLMHIRYPFKIVLKRSVIGDLNMWRGAPGDLRHMFFSEQLYRRVLSEGLSPLRALKVEVE